MYRAGRPLALDQSAPDTKWLEGTRQQPSPLETRRCVRSRAGERVGSKASGLQTTGDAVVAEVLAGVRQRRQAEAVGAARADDLDARGVGHVGRDGRDVG